MKFHKIILLLVLLFIISYPCMAFDSGGTFINIFLGVDYYNNKEINSIFDFSSLGLGLGFKLGEGNNLFETGLLSEYNLSNILRIRPFLHVGLTGSLFLGAFGYIGLSGVFLTDFNSNLFGISPEFGIGFWLFAIGTELKIQYDFHQNKKYNCFIISGLLSIPLLD
jgi:hypothetical protein